MSFKLPTPPKPQPRIIVEGKAPNETGGCLPLLVAIIGIQFSFVIYSVVNNFQ